MLCAHVLVLPLIHDGTQYMNPYVKLMEFIIVFKEILNMLGINNRLQGSDTYLENQFDA